MTDPSAAVLSVRSVTKCFNAAGGAVTALDAVDMHAAPGDAISIVGPNGAGKSTLLALIAGVMVPTEGTIQRTGRCASLLELGAGLHDDLTGSENLDLALTLTGLSGTERRRTRRSAEEFAAIGEKALRRPIKHLSSGMLARLVFAAAFCTRPDILLIDEVLAVGDDSFQRQALSAVADRVASGSILLLVTHSPDLARMASERTIWLENGRIRQQGPTQDVVADYEATMRGWGRSRAPGSVRIEEMQLSEDRIQPGDPLRVSTRLHCAADTGPVEVRLEVRPAVGDDSFWMRAADENPETREMNLVAWTPPVRINRITRGHHRVDIEIPLLPFTPTALELAVVVTDRDHRVIDELSCDLQVGDVAMRPYYLLQARTAAARNASETTNI